MSEKNERLHYFLKRTLFLATADLFAFGVAAFLALWIVRQPWEGGAAWLPSKLFLLWWCINICLAAPIFAVGGLYRMPMRTAGFSEAVRVALSMMALGVANAAYAYLSPTIHLDDAMVLMLNWSIAVIFVRFFLRFRNAALFRLQTRSAKSSASYLRVMVVGGGEAGALIIREMQTSKQIRYFPVCVIDDDPAKQHMRVGGVPVVGQRDDIAKKAEEYNVNCIFVTMPSVSASIVRDICSICIATGLPVRVIPGVYQVLDGDVKLSALRDVSIDDLLGRDPIIVNNEEIRQSTAGEVVLVTGGGGSIGSELCRQIAATNPKRLIIFDIYENNAYEIEQELRRNYPALDLLVLIGSVRDKVRVREVFAAEHPTIVYHAAAHKHVPLMETSPREAVKNNIFGTYNVSGAAEEFGAKRFVLISTDKAVNPTNVMGASKRICEMIVQERARHATRTGFALVRFGNVLGSNGSVIPLFKKQIAAGGPVTVTHKDIVRYFMTIPEAVSLVLQAGVYAKGGEIFVLDMGQPMKIVTLAENLIRLSGYKPYEDIDIVFTGLRPGEKLYEEMLMSEEGLQATKHTLIHIGKPLNFDSGELHRVLSELETAMFEENDIRPLIKQLVPTYTYTAASTATIKGE